MHVQVDGMVKESGVFYMKTDQEQEQEKRVKERTRELMEKYQAEQEQRNEAKASQQLSEAKAQSRSDGVGEYATSMNRRKESNGMEDGVEASHAHNRLCSDQRSASQSVGWVTAEPTSRLNSGKTWHHFLHLIFVLEVPKLGKENKRSFF